MGLINTLPNCESGGGNTGYGDCFFDPKIIVGGFITPLGYEITDAAVAAAGGLYQFLQLATLQPKGSRIYPVFGFVGLTDNSEDPTSTTYGYGTPENVREGLNNWLARFRKGGACLNKQMRKFNDGNWGFLPVDAAGLIMGEKTLTGLRAPDQESIFTGNWKVSTGADTTLYQTRFIFDATGMNDNPGFLTTSDLGFNIRTIQGLQNVAVQKVSRVLGVITVRLLAGCGGTNLYTDYDTELANAALWVAKNAATGNLISITSVAADPNSSGFIVTLNTTDTDYTANGVTLGLAAPLVLDGAGVSGYESNYPTITIGA